MSSVTNGAAGPVHRNVYGAPRPIWQLLERPNWGEIRGTDVEHAVSSTLNLLTYDFPELTIYHGASLNSNGMGEVDSILIYKNIIVLVEAKSTTPSTQYKFGEDGLVRKRDRRNPRGRLSKYPGNRLHEKVAEYKQKFPAMSVYGVYVFHGSEAVKMSRAKNLAIMPMQQMYAELRRFLSTFQEREVSDAQARTKMRVEKRLKASLPVGALTRHAKSLLDRNPDLNVMEGSLVLTAPAARTFRDKVKATIRVWR